MGFLDTAVDHRAEPFRTARVEMLGALARLESALDAAREGGGERAVTRHHARGKLLARERIELLVDRDSPLLELSPVSGWGTGGPVGGGVITAIGVVEDRPCVVIAHDPTVGTDGVDPVPGFAAKARRALQIARQNRLPLVWLAEDAGYDGVGDLPAGLARVAAAGIPTIAGYFGVPPAARTGPFDYMIALRSYHAAGKPDRQSGAADAATHLADDERDALRLARQCARRPRRARPAPPVPPGAPPRHDPEDLLAVPAADPWEILARVLDGSELDEIDGTGGGSPVCAGWGEVYGHPVAVLADGPVPDKAAGTAERLVRLAARSGTPLLYLAQGTRPAGPLAGPVADAGMPLLTVRIGGGPGDAALAALARFRFGWPDRGSDADDADLAASGRLADDGVIDPRDTRTVLGLCLSVIRP